MRLLGCVRAAADWGEEFPTFTMCCCVWQEFPDMNVVTGSVEAGVNDKGYMVPGIGNIAARYRPSK